MRRWLQLAAASGLIWHGTTAAIHARHVTGTPAPKLRQIAPIYNVHIVLWAKRGIYRDVR